MMKKKQSMVIKKPVFTMIFFKRLAAFALVGFIIAMVGRNAAMQYYSLYMRNETNSYIERWQSEVKSAYEIYYGNQDLVEDDGEKDVDVSSDVEGIVLFDEFSEEEREEQFLLTAEFYGDLMWENQSFALLDAETYEVVAREPMNTLHLVIGENKDKSEFQKVTKYYCQDEKITAALQEAYDECGYVEDVLDLYMMDFYVDGFRFVPGKMLLTAYPYSEETDHDVVLKELDFTPADTSGYTHIVRDEVDEKFTIIGPNWFLHETTEMQDAMDEFLAQNDLQTEVLTYDGGGGSEVDFMKVSAYEYNRLQLVDGENVKEYWAVAIGEYDLLKERKNEVVMVYAAMLIAVLMAAFIGSYTSYAKQKNIYEMDQYRRNMTNTMAHDLKSPLMVISGFAENLLETNLQDKQLHYTNSIMGNVQYMNQIIEKILELSKVENGEYILQKEAVNLRMLTDRIVEKHKGQLAEKSLDVQVAGECMIQADKLCMTQVLDNLISNAIKYTIEDAVIEICIKDKQYEIKNTSVVDFDIDVRELVNPFVKGDNSRSGKTGSGIGLTIVKNIVEQHGYQLEIEFQDDVFVARIVM